MIKKQIKSHPLFDKTQTKSVKEKLKQLERIFNAEFLDDILHTEIENRMMKDYLKKQGIDFGSVQKIYSKQIEGIYLALIPERYKKNKALTKNLIKTLNKGKNIQKKQTAKK